MIHLKDASHAYLLAMYCKKTIVMTTWFTRYMNISIEYQRNSNE